MNLCEVIVHACKKKKKKIKGRKRRRDETRYPNTHDEYMYQTNTTQPEVKYYNKARHSCHINKTSFPSQIFEGNY